MLRDKEEDVQKSPLRRLKGMKSEQKSKPNKPGKTKQCLPVAPSTSHSS